MRTDLSNVLCSYPGCAKRLKTKLIQARRTQNSNLCYEHYIAKEALRGHYINAKPRNKRIAAGLPVKVYKKEAS